MKIRIDTADEKRFDSVLVGTVIRVNGLSGYFLKIEHSSNRPNAFSLLEKTLRTFTDSQPVVEVDATLHIKEINKAG